MKIVTKVITFYFIFCHQIHLILSNPLNYDVVPISLKNILGGIMSEVAGKKMFNEASPSFLYSSLGKIKSELTNLTTKIKMIDLDTDTATKSMVDLITDCEHELDFTETGAIDAVQRISTSIDQSNQSQQRNISKYSKAISKNMNKT